MNARPQPKPTSLRLTLLNRQKERAVLDGLLGDLRLRRGGALVVHGEAGVGKSALLEHVAGAASDLQVARAAGVASEMQLAFAGLHLLCAPLLDRLASLPGPQRDALETAFGLREGAAPDRFLVGLAVLTLLSEAAEPKPLLCVVDDAQWLDAASAQALGFAARRLAAEPVGLILAAREPGEEFAGLADLEVRGLPDQDARALLGSVVRFRLDEQVRERIVAEANGNPLALLSSARELDPAQLAGGPGPVSASVQEGVRRRLAALPAETRSLMVVAAAEQAGDSTLVLRAAGRLGIAASAAAAASEAGLLQAGKPVRFPHPLVRSVVYSAASLPQRQAAHLALAEVTDPDRDPDRRAWHLAAAALGPDEQVAAELERSAGRAQARGGMAAAAAFLQRAVALTAEPVRRHERALSAAQASLQAGAFDAAAELLAMAAAGPLDERQQARADLLRGQLAFACGAGSEAPALLLKAAQRLEPLDVALARQTYLDAWAAAVFAGRFAGAGHLHEVSRAALAAPPPAGPPRPSDLLLDGFAILVTEGRAQAAPVLRQAARVFAQGEVSVEEGLRWGWLASTAAITVWDEESWHEIAARPLQSVREAGLLVQLPLLLQSMALLADWRGDLPAAAALIAEADAVAAATGSGFARYGAQFLAGLRGMDAEARELIKAESTTAQAAGQGLEVQWSQWVSAVLSNGLGRYEVALAQAQQAVEQAPELHVSAWALPELIEAASRTGQARLAADALGRLAEATSAGQTDWAQGIYARCRALVSDEDAEGWYREAIDRLSRTRLRPELARAHLLYGEWLRRQGRRTDAREQLRAAHDMFGAIGMQAFAERARHELQATGQTVVKRTTGPREQLTAQEDQISRLARAGLTNPQIGAQLFLSARTVEWHLRKIFTKLEISSRRELGQALSDAASVGSAA